MNASVPSIDAVPAAPAGSTAVPILPEIVELAGSLAGVHMNGQFIIIDAVPAVNTLVVSAMPTYEIEPGSVPASHRSTMNCAASTPASSLKIGRPPSSYIVPPACWR